MVCAGRGQSRSVDPRSPDSDGTRGRPVRHRDGPVRSSASSCSISAGSILLAQTVLTADVQIGRHVVIMPNVTLTHDDRLEDFVTVCAGVALGGSVQVGHAAYLGMNSSVRENVSVGETAVLGMGAVLLRDLPAGEAWAGVPACRLPSLIGADHAYTQLEAAP